MNRAYPGCQPQFAFIEILSQNTGSINQTKNMLTPEESLLLIIDNRFLLLVEVK